MKYRRNGIQFTQIILRSAGGFLLLRSRGVSNGIAAVLNGGVKQRRNQLGGTAYARPNGKAQLSQRRFIHEVARGRYCGQMRK